MVSTRTIQGLVSCEKAGTFEKQGGGIVEHKIKKDGSDTHS